jgi:hypothetical protein
MAPSSFSPGSSYRASSTVRGNVALAGVVCALHRDIATTNDRTENLPPLAPEELAKAIPHLADCIPDVRVLGWVKQINENGPSGE